MFKVWKVLLTNSTQKKRTSKSEVEVLWFKITNENHLKTNFKHFWDFRYILLLNLKTSTTKKS